MGAGATIQRGVRPGLLGAIAGAHGTYYAREWGIGQVFESIVARECADVVDRAGDDELFLSAWDGDEFVGSLVIDGNDPGARPNEARLRWFIVTRPGSGLGGKMMEEAMRFLDERGKRCFLTTVAGLDAARKLYERHGFELVAQERAETWGTVLEEQRFERPAKEN